MKNKLFAPAIVLMNRLNFTRKFIVLGLIYFVAIAVVVYGLYASLNQVARTSQRQLEGLELIKPISRAVQFMQQHCGLSTGVLGGNEAMRSAIDTKEIEIAAAFDLIAQQLPAGLILSEDWTRLKADWNSLRKDWPHWTADRSCTLHTDLVDRMLVFEAHIADDYALTFGSDIDAFYLIDTIINKMPQALERLGQIRALGTGILAKKQISAPQQFEMGVLIAELRHELNFLVINLEKTGRFNPQIQSPLSAATKDIVDSMNQVIDLVSSDIISGHFVTSSEDYFKTVTAVIDKGYRQMAQLLLPKAEALITTRVQHTENNLHLYLGIAVLLLLVVPYFFIGIYYAMVGSMRSLIRSARVFASGDMDECIDLGTRDELREVGDSFNEMVDGFNALLAVRLEDKIIETRLRSIIDASPISMVVSDDRQNITFLNPAFIQTFGYALEDIPTLADWWSKAAGSDPEYRKSMAASWQGMVVHSDSQFNPVEFSIQCRSGSTKTVLANASLVEQASGAVCLVALYDITWRKQAEADLRIAAIAFDIQEAMMVTDASQVILKVNQAFTRITGYSAEEAVGNTPALLKSGHQDAKFYQTMWESLARDGYWQSEIWNRRKCGEIYPERITITAVTNAEGKATNYIATFDDISKYKKAEETIHDLVFYDSLTKLPNRRLLLERLRHSIEVERREGKQLAVMMLDLDRFKVINDSLGYVAGDELLQQVAARIASRLRKVDLVARVRKVDLLAHLGGDEFIMLLEDITHTEDAARVAEHIRSYALTAG
ncbi:PAS domain S-box protein [Candidatus Methylobacter oryzae]|uniref:PAS domain S-box protein n=1 Tax=Candidatus Methylobacter oryzae TaxID=2497749 RepID=A0ABY3CCU3_9GAMM|nr:PAS domain S-box protein [Candidatus Methylobacter oryzae]TRW98068.1 PAS domain S-box protein [Candidatus Methylobacter oryzae]